MRDDAMMVDGDHDQYEAFGEALDSFLDNLSIPLTPDIKLLMAVAFTAGWEADK